MSAARSAIDDAFGGIGDAAGVPDPRPDPRPQPSVSGAPILPLLLLVDTSNSMNTVDDSEPVLGRGLRRLDHLTAAIVRLFAELREIGDARRGGEVAMITFGEGQVAPRDLRPPAARRGPSPSFVPLIDAEPPEGLTAGLATPLAGALDAAADLLEERQRQLTGRLRYRAILWILTDGQNSDDLHGYFTPVPQAPIDRLRAMEADRRLLVFAGALPGANMHELGRIAPESTFPIRDAAFRDITKLIVMSSDAAGSASAAPASAIYDSLAERFGRWTD